MEAEISRCLPDGAQYMFKVRRVHALNPHLKLPSLNMGAGGREIKRYNQGFVVWFVFFLKKAEPLARDTV